MPSEADDRALITAYLLGELPEHEQTRLELRYFVDDELFKQVIAIEDELIERYTSGRLGDGERKRLERYFIAVRGRRRRRRLTGSNCASRGHAGR